MLPEELLLLQQKPLLRVHPEVSLLQQACQSSNNKLPQACLLHHLLLLLLSIVDAAFNENIKIVIPRSPRVLLIQPLQHLPGLRLTPYTTLTRQQHQKRRERPGLQRRVHHTPTTPELNQAMQRPHRVLRGWPTHPMHVLHNPRNRKRVVRDGLPPFRTARQDLQDGERDLHGTRIPAGQKLNERVDGALVDGGDAVVLALLLLSLGLGMGLGMGLLWGDEEGEQAAETEASLGRGEGGVAEEGEEALEGAPVGANLELELGIGGGKDGEQDLGGVDLRGGAAGGEKRREDGHKARDA